jgi:hypothetical protein
MTDRLERWMAARGVGSWEAFKDAHAWVHVTSETAETSRDTPSTRAQALGLFGRAEFDWRSKTWVSLQAAVAGLCDANFAGILVGLPRREQVARLEEIERGDATDVLIERTVAIGSERVALLGSSDEDLQEAAEHIGCRFVPDAGSVQASNLPDIRTLFSNCSSVFTPPPGVRTDKFTFDSDQPWERVRAALEPGMYRLKPEFGPTRFFVREGAGVCRAVIDRQVAVARAAEIDGRPTFRYQPSERRLYVPAWALPPTPHARALVLCSGSPPRRLYDQAFPGANLYFTNIPEAVGDRVAAALKWA